MIKEITIEIEGKEIKLTEEQAKKLKCELDELFGKKEYIPYPVPSYNEPYIYRYQHWTYPVTVTWSSDTKEV